MTGALMRSDFQVDTQQTYAHTPYPPTAEVDTRTQKTHEEEGRTCQELEQRKVAAVRSTAIYRHRRGPLKTIR